MQFFMRNPMVVSVLSFDFTKRCPGSVNLMVYPVYFCGYTKWSKGANKKILFRIPIRLNKFGLHRKKNYLSKC